MARRRRFATTNEGDPLVPMLSLTCLLIPLLLLGSVFVKYHVLPVGAPKYCTGAGCESKPDTAEDLGLTLMITDQGFHLKVNPAHRKSWMAQGGGPDIPALDGGFDYRALTERLAEIKRDHRGETLLRLGAEDDIRLDVLIGAMDAARGTADAPLFPDVVLVRGVV
jgi:hypothetical protein